MNLTSWLGIGFVVLLSVVGLTAVGLTLRSISRSDLDESGKSKWGLLIGLSPLAGMYTWHRKDELLGHSDGDAEHADRNS